MKVKRRLFGGRSYIEESLYNVCKWWCETYRKDVFVHKPREIVEMRKLAEKILEKANERK